MSKGHSLYEIARIAMLARGFEADFSPNVLKQLEGISSPAHNVASERDLTRLLWCSIDNDDSRDLDQLTVAEPLPNGRTKILIGIADVDALVKTGTPIDGHAKANTTTVYTGVRTFPMLPEKLSTNLTSLSENEIRRSVITEITVDQLGHIVGSEVYQAAVKNQAKLAYNEVSDWLEGKGPIPKVVASVPGMDRQLRLQDELAQKMRKLRHEYGALELETIEPRPIMKDDEVVDLTHDKKNRARELIEDFMIAANGVVARYLAQKGFPSIREMETSDLKLRVISLDATVPERL